MATTIADLGSTKTLTNLDTYTYTIKTAGMHMVKVDLNELPPSGITITIKQNTTTLASLSAPAAAQGVMTLQAVGNFAVSDTVNVVIASSTATDQGPNKFKATLNIHLGST